MANRRFPLILATLGVAIFVSMAGVLVLYLAVGREPRVPSAATLVLRVGGDLSEIVPDDVFTYLRGVRAVTVRSVVESLRKAKVDTRIRAVLVKPTGFDSPYWGKVQEIRDAMLDFKESGKPLYVYLEYGRDQDYYLATAADRIYLMPSSSLDLTGVATYALFLKGTLDKIGAYPDLHRIGDYKTAVNTFTEDGYTPAHKEMDEARISDLFDQLVSGIATGRGKDEVEVRELIDQGPFLPEDALRAGLVDGVVYEDEVSDLLEDESDLDETAEIEGDRYAQVSASSLGLNRGPRLAVIYAAGTITGGESGFDPINGPIVGSETLIDYIRQARRDDSVRGIVLRIDSPGGSATASDAVWRELMLAKTEREDRPIVASMSDVAASGGYYIAMPAAVIVAQPSTLTGSIGIFGGKVVTGGVYAKLGMNIESTSRGRNAEINSPARPYNPDEVGKLEEQLRAFYDQFVEKVAESRRATPEEIEAVAAGRVWTGRQATERGLVDELGGLDTAIDAAKRLAGIDPGSDVEVVVYPPRKSFYELLSDQLSGANQSLAIGRWLSASLSAGEMELLRAARSPLSIFRSGEPLALMPFRFLR
jgi:protease-4